MYELDDPFEFVGDTLIVKLKKKKKVRASYKRTNLHNSRTNTAFRNGNTVAKGNVRKKAKKV